MLPDCQHRWQAAAGERLTHLQSMPAVQARLLSKPGSGLGLFLTLIAEQQLTAWFEQARHRRELPRRIEYPQRQKPRHMRVGEHEGIEVLSIPIIQ